MNVEMLEKVKAQILAHPRRFLMSTWVEHKGITDNAHPGSYIEYGELRTFDEECGTAGCIAGWTCLLQYKDPKLVLGLDVEGNAQGILGIEDKPTENLFCVGSWPEPYRTQYTDSRDMQERAQIAAARIDHFIATKGEE